MLPHVIIHNVVSLDGRNSGFEPDLGLFYGLIGEWREDATLVGCDTLLSAGAEEPNAIVQLESGPRTIPNLRATQVEIYDGMMANSVNCWPGLRFDVGAINNVASRLIPAGFYYKTFM